MSTSQNDLTDAYHLRYVREALNEARRSPPKPSNFRVGCVIVSFHEPSSPSVLSTGYTLELEGNTHAEQCALAKLAVSHGIPEASVGAILTPETRAVLYTTLEPCGKRLSGNTPCVQRIIATREVDPKAGVRKVIFGAKEPGTFVQDSQSCRMLTEAGVEWEYVPGLEDEILSVAMEGHVQKEQSGPQEQKAGPNDQPARQTKARGTNVDDISPEERKRQEAQPRNPKKRMMEAPPGSG
jgi:pyrimidine deaminase RibD-like protein